MARSGDANAAESLLPPRRGFLAWMLGGGLRIHNCTQVGSEELDPTSPMIKSSLIPPLSVLLKYCRVDQGVRYHLGQLTSAWVTSSLLPISRPYTCNSESAFAGENDALTKDPLTGRVSKKRKSRASKRSPTTYIAADPANFRELVQRITGTPTVEPAGEQQHRAAAGQGSRLLPSRDTSSFYFDRASLGRVEVDVPELPECDPFSLLHPFDSWGVI
ncbi:hypothetical protein C4D60_Mb09t04570 [Musa balbisiana]|uniref:VQ domain-containing protein n=1 Tax=Musa balbisiana TaxID=52838 RepID=A0A4S8IGF1_MUSBA|nr:hypothetical protein C4D60_Mb09t04570 [Musa balbisiana]